MIHKTGGKPIAGLKNVWHLLMGDFFSNHGNRTIRHSPPLRRNESRMHQLAANRVYGRLHERLEFEGKRLNAFVHQQCGRAPRESEHLQQVSEIFQRWPSKLIRRARDS